MNKLEALEQRVHELYDAKDTHRAEWADWMAANHVFVVADKATSLAKRFGADPKLSRAAALLHDIADARMGRFDENHEQESLHLARELLQQADFDEDEISVIVDDAIRLHSCRNGAPHSLEGKVLATADALAHLETDFYFYGVWSQGKSGASFQDAKQWVLPKLERDYRVKIQFEEVREELASTYRLLKELLDR